MRGILMVMVTLSLWGVLPIFLKVALNQFSAGTIAWFRFLFSFIILLAFLSVFRSGGRKILKHPPLLGIFGGVALAGNYYGMTQGVHFSGPSNAAIIIQVAPILLVVAGIVIFRESVSRRQIIGMAVAAAGFFLFYLDRAGDATDPSLYALANGWVLFGAVVWALYMIFQKRLSTRFEAQSLNLLVYGAAAVALVPLVEWNEFNNSNAAGWIVLIFLGMNTLLAYGALAEAVERVPLSLISILITLNPLITLAGMWVLNTFWVESLPAENIGWTGYLGGAVAVGGVTLVVSSQKS